jgi:hypothetical protein
MPTNHPFQFLAVVTAESVVHVRDSFLAHAQSERLVVEQCTSHYKGSRLWYYDARMADADFFRLCTTCKKPIPFEAAYYLCSVSTCNRKKLGMFFCSVPCWDAHVPMMRHRDAWAEPAKAPSKAEWQRQQQEEEREAAPAAGAPENRMTEDSDKRRRIVGAPESDADLPRDVLVVVSKLKAYVRARSGMNTSDNVVEVLSDHLRKLCDLAIDGAAKDGRKTVLDRDFRPILR